MIASEVIKAGKAQFNSRVEAIVSEIIESVVGAIKSDPSREELMLYNTFNASIAQLNAASVRLTDLGYDVRIVKGNWWISQERIYISGWNKELPKNDQPYR